MPLKASKKEKNGSRINFAQKYAVKRKFSNATTAMQTLSIIHRPNLQYSIKHICYSPPMCVDLCANINPHYIRVYVSAVDWCNRRKCLSINLDFYAAGTNTRMKMAICYSFYLFCFANFKFHICAWKSQKNLKCHLELPMWIIIFIYSSAL